MKTTYFNKPDLQAKRVLLFFHGNFPKNCIMHKDATLPLRLFPNAEFVIRCSKTEETIHYFNELYSGHSISFVSENDQSIFYDLDNFDCIYAHYILMCTMRANLMKCVVDFQRMIYTANCKTYVFFNDENIEPFKFVKDFVSYQYTKNNIKINRINPYLTSSFEKVDLDRTDMSHIYLLVNENKITNWGDNCYKQYNIQYQFNICYLSDEILYDFPVLEKTIASVHETYTKNGIFIAFYLKERVDLINKIFNHSTDLNMLFLGKHSEKLLPRWKNKYTGSLIENTEIPRLLKSASWSMYIGKACKSKYLGATFYEPIFVGTPVFIWTGTDPEHKIFPDLDCYFNDERDLYELIQKTDLKQLITKQIKSIYEN